MVQIFVREPKLHRLWEMFTFPLKLKLQSKLQWSGSKQSLFMCKNGPVKVTTQIKVRFYDTPWQLMIKDALYPLLSFWQMFNSSTVWYSLCNLTAKADSTKHDWIFSNIFPQFQLLKWGLKWKLNNSSLLPVIEVGYFQSIHRLRTILVVLVASTPHTFLKNIPDVKVTREVCFLLHNFPFT